MARIQHENEMKNHPIKNVFYLSIIVCFVFFVGCASFFENNWIKRIFTKEKMGWHAKGTEGVIAAGKPAAVKAGIAMLEQGGMQLMRLLQRCLHLV